MRLDADLAPMFAFPVGDSRKEKRRVVRRRESRRQAASRAARTADGYRCQYAFCRCRTEPDNPLAFDLQAAHIDPRRPHRPDLDCLSNLITLCALVHPVIFDNGGYDQHGRYLTALQFKNHVLDLLVDEPNYRWREKHNEIRRKLGLPPVEHVKRIDYGSVITEAGVDLED